MLLIEEECIFPMFFDILNKNAIKREQNEICFGYAER